MAGYKKEHNEYVDSCAMNYKVWSLHSIIELEIAKFVANEVILTQYHFQAMLGTVLEQLGGNRFVLNCT